MRLTGEQQIGASRDDVWQGINDPETLRRSIPGCQSLELTDENQMTAVVEIKIGPISARFNGAVSLTDLKPPSSYTIVGEGKGGMAGNARGKADVTLTEIGGGTLLRYIVEAEVGGRLAQLGGPIVDATAKQLAAKFFQNFEQQLTGATQAATGTVAQTPATQPSASTGSLATWMGVSALAILAGFLLGRSDMADWWVAVMIGLMLGSALLGHQVGRRGRT